MQLRNDDALRPVDDERAVLRHQRNVAIEDFLLLDVANGLRAGIGILVINRQPNGNFERRGVRHAALLAFIHVILQLHGHGVAALVAERRRVLVERAALVANDVAGLVRIRNHRSSAIAAGGAQMMQSFQVAALALPVADRVVHEFQLRHLAKIFDRKHGCKHRLKPGVIALARQQIHLQKALIGFHLDFNQVGNLYRALDFCEIQPLMLFGMRDLPHPFRAWCGKTPRGHVAAAQQDLPKVSAHTATGVPSGTHEMVAMPNLSLRR